MKGGPFGSELVYVGMFGFVNPRRRAASDSSWAVEMRRVRCRGAVCTSHNQDPDAQASAGRGFVIRPVLTESRSSRRFA